VGFFGWGLSAKLASVSSTPAGGRSRVARFGTFELDLDARELRKSGRRLRVQDQPFAVLAVLLDQPGSIVNREDLRTRLWPADTFVDFDHSLNTAVNKLREALGDSASNPRFIETVARRGYRFVAEVQWSAGSLAGTYAVGNQIASDVQRPSDLPQPHRGATRALFGLIQIMYLIFYVEAAIHWQGIERVSWVGAHALLALCVVLVTAAIGIPVRLYFLSAVAFDYARLGQKLHRIFLGVFVLDELWAVSPFLISDRIGLGAALASTAALLYVPFAERTLARMAYPESDAKNVGPG
jgi:DNA-binding winged helix-turn-helix (wHTH) protein